MLKKVVSGGQTGVDRAGLDAAMAHGLVLGGWCPRGRRAEDGRIPQRYPLDEMPSTEYGARTLQNVLDSDGTLVLTWGEATGGTAATIALARREGRPSLVLDLGEAPDPATVVAWIEAEDVTCLNIAGPRASKAAGVHAAAHSFLSRVFDTLAPR